VYLRFFNLREQPFSITPDPRFLFLSPQHEAALSSLLYGISERKGFIEITGEVGTGKTVLCRTLMDRLDDTVSTALIFNSYLNEIELLQAILNDFGIFCAETSRKGYIDALNQYLLQEFAASRNAMVLIDEAQNLEPRVLEQLRMLSNLETERGKLLQVVLVGQPELRDRLATPQMRQLDQRIAVRYHIHSLTRAETQQYIMHRLSVAGAANAIVFTRRALAMIYQYCAGTPRRINLLCDRVLITAYVHGTHRITTHIVRQSINDLEGARASRSRLLRLRPTLIGIAAGGLAGATLMGIISGWLPARLAQEHLRHLLFSQTPPAVQPLRTDPPAPPTAEILTTLAAPQPVSPTPPPPPHVDEVDMALARKLWQLNVQAQAVPRLASQVSWSQPNHLVQLADQAGLDLQLLRSSPSQLAHLSRPCLIEVYPQLEATTPSLWVLIRGSTEDAVIYREPEGLSIITLPELRRIWSGNLYLTLDQSETMGPMLKQGMSGLRVQTLQHILNDLNYLSEAPTGQFDTRTEQAVRAFQRDYQLAVDGYVGRNTLMVLSHFDKKTPAAISDIDPLPQPDTAPQQKPAASIQNPQPQETQERDAALVPPVWRYSIQVGSFRLAEQAERLRNRLIREGYTAWVQPSQVSGQGTWHRVRVGHFTERSEADEVATRLADQEQLTVLIAAETQVEKEPAPHEHH
jgi:general secretion pathway protein A